MKNLFLLLSLFLYILPVSWLAAQSVNAGNSISITVSGAIPYVVTAAEISGIKRHTLRVPGADRKKHTYTGVPLAVVLALAKVPLGEAYKKTTAKYYVVLRAADGYRAVCALAEIDPLFASGTIILADTVDGKPLRPEAGPFQVIVPSDKKQGRWVRQLLAIEVLVAD